LFDGSSVYEDRKKFIRYIETGDYDSAIEKGERLYKLQKNDKADLDFCDDIYNLAKLYDSVLNFKKSISLYRQSIKIINSKVGRNKALIVREINLAVALCHSNKHKDAVVLLMRIIKDYENKKPVEVTQYIKALYNLGNAYFEIFDFESAMHYLNIAHEQMGNVNDIELSIEICNSIGYLYEGQGNFNEAIKYFEFANKHFEENAYDKRGYIKNLFYLATVYDKNDNNKQAINLFKRCSEFILKELGDKHYSYDICQQFIAKLYDKIAKEDEGFTLEKAMDKLEESKFTNGENSIQYSDCLKEIAVIYSQLDNLAMAEEFLNKSITLKQELLGEEDTSVVKDMLMLAGIYFKFGEFEKGTELLAKTTEGIDVLSGQFEDIVHELLSIYISIFDVDKVKSKGFCNTDVNMKNIDEILDFFHNL
jgi:tetratricopeptide (TPR) repeat protein